MAENVIWTKSNRDPEWILKGFRKFYIQGKGAREYARDYYLEIMRRELFFLNPLEKTTDQSQTAKAKAYREYLESGILEGGLQTTLEKFEEYWRGDDEVLNIHYQYAVKGRGGNNNPEGIGGKSRKKAIVKGNNITIDKKAKSMRGTGKAWAIRKLARENKTELLERVQRGEISANAAMIEAGFRHKTYTVKKDVDSIVKFIKKYFNITEIHEIKNKLNQ